MSTRRILRFSSPDDVIDDVKLLRAGCSKVGRWSLEQTCWHLNTVITNLMRPGPHPANTPQQNAAGARLEIILASESIKAGMPAPEKAVPPGDCGREAIDQFIETTQRWKSFGGPYAPHPLFGNLSNDEMRRLHLIHCAHHLSHLVPKDAGESLR